MKKDILVIKSIQMEVILIPVTENLVDFLVSQSILINFQDIKVKLNLKEDLRLNVSLIKYEYTPTNPPAA